MAKKDRITTKYGFDETKREMRWTFGAGIADVVFNPPEAYGESHGENPIDSTIGPALLNGYKQKIADAMAISVDTTTGKSATMQEKAAAARAMAQQLADGIWNAARAAAMPKTVDVTALVAVIAAKLDKSPIGVRAYVEAKDEAGRRALADSAEFAESYVLQVAKSRPLVALSADEQSELDAIE